MEALEYKCPACGGGLKFDAASGNMVCEYCDSVFTLEELKRRESEVQHGTVADPNAPVEPEQNVDADWDYQETEEKGDFVSFLCPSCGAEIIGDATTAATECIYCGNPTVLTQQLTGIFRPDYVIPFRQDKKAAKESLKRLCEGKKLLPKFFLEESHIDKISGVYVPYWLFDCDTQGSIDFDATRSEMYSDSRYNYTRTNHFRVTREATMSFQNLPVDGSEKLDAKYTEAIEPYDYSELKPYDHAYLSGYLADKYDVDAEAAMPRANERVLQSATAAIMATVDEYSTVTPLRQNIQVKNGKVSYALLPIWFLNTKFKGETYTFAMNGQTGKVIGDLPVDKGKYWRWVLGLGAGITVAITAIASLLF